MTLKTLPLLLFFLWVAGYAAADEQAAPRENAPPRTETPILNAVFRSQFDEQRLARFPASPGVEELARQMSPEQRLAARAQLLGREAQAKTLSERQEIARGYLLLDDPRQALRIAAALKEENPRNPETLSLTANASYRLGDYRSAAENARAALEINPKDPVAHATWMLSKDRGSSQAKLPSDPFGENEGETIDGGQRGSPNRPNLTAIVAKSVLANIPIPPSPDESAHGDAKKSALPGAIATMALASAGGFLLFMGLGAGALEDKFPNIRRNMGIAAGVSGVVAAGALSLPALVPATSATSTLTATPATSALLAPAAAGGGTFAQAGKTISLAQATERTAAIGGGIFGLKRLVDQQAGPSASLARPVTTSRKEAGTIDQEQLRAAQYDRAKNFCDTPPPPGNNECSKLSRQIDHAERCVELYEAWDAQWEPGRHIAKIGTWRQRRDHLKAEHKKKCTQK